MDLNEKQKQLLKLTQSLETTIKEYKKVCYQIDKLKNDDSKLEQLNIYCEKLNKINEKIRLISKKIENLC